MFFRRKTWKKDGNNLHIKAIIFLNWWVDFCSNLDPKFMYFIPVFVACDQMRMFERWNWMDEFYETYYSVQLRQFQRAKFRTSDSIHVRFFFFRWLIKRSERTRKFPQLCFEIMQKEHKLPNDHRHKRNKFNLTDTNIWRVQMRSDQFDCALKLPVHFIKKSKRTAERLWTKTVQWERPNGRREEDGKKNYFAERIVDEKNHENMFCLWIL